MWNEEREPPDYMPYGYGPVVVVERGTFRFSGEEIRQILISILVLSLAFTLVTVGGVGAILSSAPLYVAFVAFISLVSVCTAFLFHELAHKYVAQRYGCWAEFRMSGQGLALALFTAFIGFLFAAPGAVVVRGNIGRSEMGRVAAAGPLTNAVIGLLFLVADIALPHGILSFVFISVAQINIYLGLFNLIPFGEFDGRKIVSWSVPVFVAMILLLAGLFLAVSGFLFDLK